MKKFYSAALLLILCFSLLTGCGAQAESANSTPQPGNDIISEIDSEQHIEQKPEQQPPEKTPDAEAEPEDPVVTEDNTSNTEQQAPADTPAPVEPVVPSSFDYSTVPAFSGAAYVAVNGNVPYFTQGDYTTNSFEVYSDLDAKGRCGVVYANIGQDLMPTEERGSIGMVKPTGWHTVKYDCVDGKYLYNRCHLIGFQLSGENANTSNLITGTRYLNIEGMLPFENMVADYVKETDNHVLYRVTPVFEDNNLVAAGVLMEGYSVEDKGDGITFCVFAYNVQPGVEINYATGDSSLVGGAEPDPEPTPEPTPAPPVTPVVPADPEPEEDPTPSAGVSYVANKNTKKFHYPTCSSADDIKEKNRWDFTGDRQELIDQGYAPCKRCNP